MEAVRTEECIVWSFFPSLVVSWIVSDLRREWETGIGKCNKEEEGREWERGRMMGIVKPHWIARVLLKVYVLNREPVPFQSMLLWNKIQGVPSTSRTWVGLTLIWIVPLSAPFCLG